MHKLLLFVLLGAGIALAAPSKRNDGFHRVAAPDDLQDMDPTMKEIFDDLLPIVDGPIRSQLLQAAEKASKPKKGNMMSPTSGRRRVTIGAVEEEDDAISGLNGMEDIFDPKIVDKLLGSDPNSSFLSEDQINDLLGALGKIDLGKIFTDVFTRGVEVGQGMGQGVGAGAGQGLDLGAFGDLFSGKGLPDFSNMFNGGQSDFGEGAEALPLLKPRRFRK